MILTKSKSMKVLIIIYVRVFLLALYIRIGIKRPLIYYICILINIERNFVKEFETEKKESFYTRLYRFGLNIYPAYRRSSGRVRFISDDWKEMHVSIKLGLRNWNINMSVFGGSIYASIDPIFAIQLRNIFGKEYVIWDKEAHIVFKKPIKKKVAASFIIDDDVIAEIKNNLEEKGEYYLTLPVKFVDKVGNVHMKATKVVYIATKESYARKIKRKKEFLIK